MGGSGQMKPYKVYVPSKVTVHLGLGLFPPALLGSVGKIYTN